MRHDNCNVGYHTLNFVAILPPDNQRPSVQQQQSPELRVFQEKRFILHTGILNNIQDIARRAFAWHLIPGGVSRIITDPFNHLTTDERTDQLLKELESRVKIDPAVLMKFVDMLRESDAACYSTLISNISKFCTVASYFLMQLNFDLYYS